MVTPDKSRCIRRNAMASNKRNSKKIHKEQHVTIHPQQYITQNHDKIAKTAAEIAIFFTIIYNYIIAKRSIENMKL